MEYLPLCFKLINQPCLIVGAGEVAARKIELLIKAQAKITVIAENISDAIHEIAERYPIEIRQQRFQADDVKSFQLVISATANTETNLAVANAANTHHLPVNVVDNPQLCSFIFPAIIDRTPIIAAVTSSGASPVLTRLLRAKLETVLPAKLGELASLAQQFRPRVKQAFATINERRKFWEQLFEGSVPELIYSGQIEQAKQALTRLLKNQPSDQNAGEVYLVGAGPGDPDLLTFRALRLMQQADVVLYDRLVSAEILELTRRDAKKIYVGKQRNNHTLQQESINELLAKLAKQGNRVLRLKGGDPFIFGRGGEEIETLMQENIRFQVVPGITAASGCATYSGIPLTHRDHAHSCLFVTGHLQDHSLNLNWRQLAQPKQTVVVYMGLSALDQICDNLIKHGCSSSHPIAIIQQGTTHNQQTLTGTLKSLPELVKEKQVKAPTLIIIGSVVQLHEKLNWYN